MRGEEALPLARLLIGHRLDRLERVRYRFQNVDRDDDDLIVWAEGAAHWFRSGADGERLVVQLSRWVDPFEGAEEANRDYLREHGRHVLVDVSGDEPYRDAFGELVTDVLPLTYRAEVLIGVQVRTASALMNVFVAGDELCVTFGDESVPLWRR